MSRCSLLSWFLFLAASLGTLSPAWPAERPNVILIMADDLGYETLGANGGTSYRTPTLDQLAASGVRFEHCYVQPLCTPTRVQLMTGAYNVRNYTTFGQMDPGLTTFGNLFRNAGYATCVTGKWQLGQAPDLPHKFGFDEHCLWQHTRRPPRYANPGLEINGVAKDFDQGEYGPDLVNEYACDFIVRQKDRPFFLYYPMILTHGPYQPTPDSPRWDPQARGENVLQRPEHFGDMVAYMDKLIGRLVATLDECNLRRKTLLIFLGDNGTGKGTRSQMGDRLVVGGKGTTTAAGMHVPCIVNWPEVMSSGRVSPELIDSTDFLPTICAAAGVTLPSDMPIDGRSFLPLLRGEAGPVRPWVYSWYSPRGEAVREFAFDQHYKLYRSGEFYDLQRDREEREPLARDRLSKEAAAAAQRLQAALDQYRDARPERLTAGRKEASAAEPNSKKKKKAGRKQQDRQAATSSPASTPRDFDLTRRVPWTTSRVTGSPEPPLPYETEQVFPGLKLKNPLDLVAIPGTDRLIVVEQAGKIYSFPNRPDVTELDLVLDVAQALPGIREMYAIAFHPDFTRNRYCYICAIGKPDEPDGTRISRFTLSAADPPTIDPASERVIITWPSGGHNGCCLKFGLDGYLYISTGDGVGPNPPDPKRTGQDVSDLLSSILRIDVDQEEGGRPYRIPDDNPFRSLSGARPEIWAYGLRNPWRMSIDPRSGDLWVGDVGWELWEMLYRVEPGGNYGWAVMEGPQPTNPEWPVGPTPILPPTVAHPHSESSSITGGPVYTGSRLPELTGALIYGDYDTGKIWGLRWEHGQVTWHRELADTTLRIVGFGEDHGGELYLIDHVAGTLHRLVPNPRRDQPSTFPRTLSEAGLFASVAEQIPAPGVLPYSIHAEPWADYATAERWLAIPGTSAIQTNGNAWQFPPDSVLVKTLSLELEQGNPASRKLIETQLLHFSGVEWRAYTYAWNSEQTDAELVGAAGAEQSLEVMDKAAPGGRRRQNWRFASRAECLRCHNPWSGSALGFQPAQLNKSHAYGATTANQLDTLSRLGLCTPEIPADKRPQLTDPYGTSGTLEARARAYLHANCAHCHRLHAGGSVLSVMQYDLPLAQTRLLDERPTQGTFNIRDAAVIAPGDPARSVLLYRMAKTGGGRMPHLGSQLVDPAGVNLIADWIASLPQGEKGPEKRPELPAATAEQLRLIKHLQESPGGSPAAEPAVEGLLASTSGALRLQRAIDTGIVSGDVRTLAIARANQRPEPEIRDLFERYLPDEQRIQRLGSVVRPEEILKLPGDASRGRMLFFETAGVQCKNCHRVQGQGRELGPDLSQIGKKYNAAQLLESLLEPSKFIDPKYASFLVETADGKLVTGLLVERDGMKVVIRDAQDQLHTFAAQDIERLALRQQSLMPELLLKDLTAEQVADLLAFLHALK